jgi:hypothetical protein
MRIPLKVKANSQQSVKGVPYITLGSPGHRNLPLVGEFAHDPYIRDDFAPADFDGAVPIERQPSCYRQTLDDILDRDGLCCAVRSRPVDAVVRTCYRKFIRCS